MYNPTNLDVTLDGWSVQSNINGTDADILKVFNLSGTIKSHGFYLIAGTAGTRGIDVPTADAQDNANDIAAYGSGKVVLVKNSTTPIETSTDLKVTPRNPAVIDAVGWGTTGAYKYSEGSAAPNHGLAMSILRNGLDTDNNANDFVQSTPPNPRNSSSPTQSSLAISTATPTVAPTATPTATPTSEPNVVISEVYGGGGISTEGYKNDFIELYNPTDI